MNNLTLGTDEWTYYETLGGGQGACPDADGPSAVHVAMSNTLNTPVEALELEFPLRVTEYALRRGSGGAGRHRGGDGIVRRIEFRAPMTVAVLANHRRIAPFGLAGGGPGAKGINRILRADGRSQLLSACAAEHVEPGDAIEIETPGGGGFG
jgi:N-methylhydantoinase B/oxoprolinase/acetone carboxylase alpha subunit